MNIRKIILYKKINDRILNEYSRFKFGDKIIIGKYYLKLSGLINKEIKKKKDYAVYTDMKAPLNNYYKKNSLLLAEKIAKHFKLPLIIGEFSFRYDEKNFYDNSLKRKTHKVYIKNGKKLKNFNYNIILIDDAILTGNSLKASIKGLKQITQNDILCFYILDLKKSKYPEKDVNNFYFNKNGISFLSKLLKDKNYFLTTNFLRTVNALDDESKKELFRRVDNTERLKIKKAINIYTRK